MKTVQNKIDEGRTYRDMEVRIAGEETEERVVEGYATTFNQPYLLWREDDYEVWEQVDARAFENCDMTDVIMQYDHEGRVFARNSNGTLSLNPDEEGLHVSAELGGTEIGRQLYEEIKGGYTNKMSFGFIVGEDKREITEGEGLTKVLRTILRISKLFDVSAVSLPANNATVISARSYGEGVIAEAKKELLEEQKRQKQRQDNINRIKIICEV